MRDFCIQDARRMPVSETATKITLISAEGGGVPEERVGPNCGFVVTVRVALKRQVVLTNHVVQILDIADGKTLVFSDQVIEHPGGGHEEDKLVLKFNSAGKYCNNGRLVWEWKAVMPTLEADKVSCR
jgi:hypothetical protein